VLLLPNFQRSSGYYASPFVRGCKVTNLYSISKIISYFFRDLQATFLYQLSKNFCSFFERTAKVRDSLFHAKFFSSSSSLNPFFHISFYSANILSKNFFFSHRFFQSGGKDSITEVPAKYFLKKIIHKRANPVWAPVSADQVFYAAAFSTPEERKKPTTFFQKNKFHFCRK
jgi:hypothetical protein